MGRRERLSIITEGPEVTVWEVIPLTQKPVRKRILTANSGLVDLIISSFTCLILIVSVSCSVFLLCFSLTNLSLVSLHPVYISYNRLVAHVSVPAFSPVLFVAVSVATVTPSTFQTKECFLGLVL